eukprot:1541402-Amphidinium_carterae.1
MKGQEMPMLHIATFISFHRRMTEDNPLVRALKGENVGGVQYVYGGAMSTGPQVTSSHTHACTVATKMITVLFPK